MNTTNDTNVPLQTSSREIGKRLATRRTQLGLTQEQAAEITGLSHQFFACIERGLKSMRAESIIKLCCALRISSDYLLFGKSNDIDRHYIIEMLEPLNESQLRCLEEIIKNYVIACGYDQQTT